MKEVKTNIVTVNTQQKCVLYRNRTFNYECTDVDFNIIQLDTLKRKVEHEFTMINVLEGTEEYVKGLEFMTQLPISLVDPSIYEYEISGDIKSFRKFALRIVNACLTKLGQCDFGFDRISNETLYTFLIYYAGKTDLQDTILFTICDME